MKIPLSQYGLLLNKYLYRFRGRVAALFGLLCATMGLQTVNPQVIRYFLDTAQQGGTFDQLLSAGLLFVGIAILVQALSVATTYLGEDVGWRTTNMLRADFANHCLSLHMGFHKDHTPGEMIQRIDEDVSALSNFFANFVIQVVGSVMLLLGIFATLLWEDWRLALFLLIYVFVAIGILDRIKGAAQPRWLAVNQANADLMGFLEERLAGPEDIRSNGATGYVMRQFYTATSNYYRKSHKAAVVNGAILTTMELVFRIGTIIAMAFGAYLFMEEVITIGSIYMVYHYTELLRQPLRGLTDQIQDLQRASASIERINELYQIENPIKDGPGMEPGAGAPAVEFTNVCFSYTGGDPADHNVLSRVSFAIGPGESLGLVGRTGSGKTTLVRLLFRLYDPTEGGITLNGIDLRDMEVGDLRRRVGMVTQDVQLFHATVRDNITFFDKSVKDASIMRAVEELGLTQWFSSLPEGLDTELSSNGKELSAGEAQLLALTRIFLRESDLIIFDEASSRLDPITERFVNVAVQKLLVGKTSIIIAHRLATVRQVDKIMMLDDGEVAEFGDRESLSRNPRSHFHRLLKSGLGEMFQ